MAKILVVEDEMLVAMLLEDMVINLGHTIVGPALRLDAALTLVDAEVIDLAVLDINLAGEQSFPVAAKLAARGVPFIFASGYGAAGLIAPYETAPVLQKPFDERQFAALITKALEPASGVAAGNPHSGRGRAGDDTVARAV
jgi:DNA-binding NtrC family response regulator